jgi:hypothetical protein
MRERKQSTLPVDSPPLRHRAAPDYGRFYGLIKDTGSRIKQRALGLLPGVTGALPTVQRANRAAAHRTSTGSPA